MNFNSWHFVAFFLVVFIITWPMKRYSVLWRFTMLVASYYFYGSWNWMYLGLIVFSTVFDFWIGLRLDRTNHARKWIIWSVVINLAFLAIFKYANFAIATANWGLEALDAATRFTAIDLLLPVGISFYTFQSMSYTIDVYRGDLKPRKSLLDYALFVAFFPQLVAGPIVRASEFFKELDTPKHIPAKEIGYALILIALGYVKKAVFADSIAEATDPVWNDPAGNDAWSVLLAVYGFAFQIYFDFSGYTDIAIGIAMLFGFRFPQNFNYPYLALSIQDFWRRWHMTLSRWLRDYLYIALGGNRISVSRTYVNLGLTMLLGGLWHGASWNFVIWGALHGGYLVFERLVLFRIPGWESDRSVMKIIRWTLTFHMVCFAWIFFRAKTFGEAMLVLSKLGELATTALDHGARNGLSIFFVLLGLHFVFGRYGIKHRLGEAPLPIHVAVTTSALLTLALFTPETVAPFIYFQF